ncbi:MAG: hypothetical protein JW891_09930 [Candidatus Lokiarchaeota archaeon]|nr:hypothetical protein [Candidatus Lokiarchaeota archaeon]
MPKAQKIEESEIEVKKPIFTCVVHRGPIHGTNYICPFCQTIYCYKCAKTLKSKGEKCWECGNEFKIEILKQQKKEKLNETAEQIVADIVNSHPIYNRYIDSDLGYEQLPEARTYGFGFFDGEELNKIDLLSFSLKDKREFLEEILGLGYDERKRLLNKMLEVEHINDF